MNIGMYFGSLLSFVHLMVTSFIMGYATKQRKKVMYDCFGTRALEA